jgi:spore coat protein U-like protein
MMTTAYIRALAVVIAAGWSIPAMAQSQCVQFEQIGMGARTDYQPFEATPTLDTFQVRVRRLADGVSAVRFLLVDRTPQAAGPQIGSSGPLYYDLTWLGGDSTQRVLVVGNEQPQPNTGAQVDLPRRTGEAITEFRLSIPAGQQAGARTHREDLLVRYQCLDSGGRVIVSTQEQSATIALNVTVPAYAAAYIGSVGTTRGTISFGEVSRPGAALSKSINVTALSTTPYAIEFDSENKGLLKRRRQDADGIAYGMRYGNADVADGDTMVCPVTPAPMGRGELFEVALDPGSIATLPAGRYEDTVTLTFTPRDVANVSGCTVRRR